jgi:hypothetical protein
MHETLLNVKNIFFLNCEDAFRTRNEHVFNFNNAACYLRRMNTFSNVYLFTVHDMNDVIITLTGSKREGCKERQCMFFLQNLEELKGL